MAAIPHEPFKYHKPGPKAIGQIKDFRLLLDNLHTELKVLPPTAERVLAVRYLQQAGAMINLAATLADPDTVTLDHNDEVMLPEMHEAQP